LLNGGSKGQGFTILKKRFGSDPLEDKPFRSQREDYASTDSGTFPIDRVMRSLLQKGSRQLLSEMEYAGRCSSEEQVTK